MSGVDCAPIRQNMVAAIEKKAEGNETFVPFYVASADYIDATMARLHEQDVKMGDMIREKADPVKDDIEKAIGQLEARLQGAKDHLKPFLCRPVTSSKRKEPRPWRSSRMPPRNILISLLRTWGTMMQPRISAQSFFRWPIGNIWPG